MTARSTAVRRNVRRRRPGNGRTVAVEVVVSGRSVSVRPRAPDVTTPPPTGIGSPSGSASSVDRAVPSGRPPALAAVLCVEVPHWCLQSGSGSSSWSGCAAALAYDGRGVHPGRRSDSMRSARSSWARCGWTRSRQIGRPRRPGTGSVEGGEPGAGRGAQAHRDADRGAAAPPDPERARSEVPLNVQTSLSWNTRGQGSGSCVSACPEHRHVAARRMAM